MGCTVLCFSAFTSTHRCDPQGTLNTFMSMGKSAWTEARTTITRLLTDVEGPLRDNEQLRKTAIIPLVSFCSDSCRTVQDLALQKTACCSEGRCHIAPASQHR